MAITTSVMKMVSYTFFKSHPIKYLITLGASLCVVYLGVHYLTAATTATEYTLAKVQKDTITTYVSSTGQVIVKNQVDLKPQLSANVTSVRASVGQKVYSGQTLIVLDGRNALASLRQAQANFASAQASYKKVADGASTQDVLSSQSTLDNNKLALTSAEQNAITKVVDAYNQVSDIIFVKTSSFFLNANTHSPTFSISGYPLNDQQLQSSIEIARGEFNTSLPLWKSDVNSLVVGDKVDPALVKSLERLNKVVTYLDSLLIALNGNASSDATITGYRSTVSSARSSVSALISNMITAQQSITSAESQLAQSQEAFNLKKAPPTAEDLTIAQAQLTSAEANLLTAQTNYSNTVITAPFDAVVGAVGVKIGDQANSATSAITLITANQLADLSLNEVDATKIKVGQKVTLTFDAIPDLTLAGTVVEVSPLGTVSQGVVTYNVKIAFDTQDERIRPGMSVTANIITQVKSDILSVPSEAVKAQGNSNYVETPASTFASASTTPIVPLSQAPVKTPVIVGISNDTSTEIVSGLSEGDWIIIKTANTIKSATQGSTQQNGITSLLGGNRAGAGSRGATGGAGR